MRIRLARITRRALHEAALLRLEDEHQPEHQRARHVDPQEADRQRGQRGADDDGCEHDAGRQRPDDELREVVEDVAASSTAASIDAKLSSVSTMSAAPVATDRKLLVISRVTLREKLAVLGLRPGDSGD